MRVLGTVSRKPFASGSKSARVAVVLETDAGKTYLLQRAGGNPFNDPALEELVGKRIEGKGTIDGYALYLAKWREL